MNRPRHPKQNRGKQSGKSALKTAPDSPVRPLAATSSQGVSQPPRTPSLIAAVSVILVAFCWAYWPILEYIVTQWEKEADYSHGYFVVPLALFFLWARRDRFPGWAEGLHWPGLGLIALAIMVRTLGAWAYIEPVEAWSIPLWVAGAVWLLCGHRVLWWSLPSVAFLWFMIPLPYRTERWLSLPLQGVATKISCWTLQMFGQQALDEGNTIQLFNPRLDTFHQLEVAEACSGLRIFVGIVALAFAYLVLVRRAWWERGLLLLSVLPIALIANATRIVTTGLLYRMVSGEAAHKFSHDVAGYVMIPFAAALFALVLWYLDRLVHEVELADVGSVIRQRSQ